VEPRTPPDAARDETPESSGRTSSEAPRYVFGAGGQLSTEELEAVVRSLVDAIAPFTAAWTELLGCAVEVTIGGAQPSPTPPIDDDPLHAGIGPGRAEQMFAEIAGAQPFTAIGQLGPELGAVALLIPTALGLAVVDVLLGGAADRPATGRSRRSTASSSRRSSGRRWARSPTSAMTPPSHPSCSTDSRTSTSSTASGAASRSSST
jgi:hypothetical protein